MARNRIIYNVQDVFMGSTPSEQNPYITGVPGHEILKRIDRLQSLSYSIGLPQQDINTLGRSTPSTTQKSDSPVVEVELNFIANGISNLNRMGFYTQNQATSAQKNLFSDFADSSRNRDERNFYVCTTKDGGEDIRDQSHDIPNVSGALSIHDYIHSGSKNFDVISFQDCYTTAYSTTIELGTLATSTVTLQSNNMVMYSSGSGLALPDLNLKSGIVVLDNETKLIVPKHFSVDNDNITNIPTAFAQGDITVDIISNIIPPTLGNVYVSDFTVAGHGWTVGGQTHFHQHFDAWNGIIGSLHVQATTVEHGHYIERTMLTVGKKYKVSGKVWINSSCPKLDSVRVFADPQSYIPLHIIDDYDQWVSFETEEFTATHEDLSFWGYDGEDYEWVGAGSDPFDSFYITDIVVTDVTDESIRFEDQVVQSYASSTSLPREPLQYIGNKLPSDKPLVFPITTECTLGFINTGNLKGDLFDNLNTNSDYNLLVKFREGSDVVMRHILSGAKLTDINQSSSVGGQNMSSMRFSCPNDFENNEKGFFVSGSMATFTHQIIDSNGNFIVNNSQQNIGQSFFPPF